MGKKSQYIIRELVRVAKKQYEDELMTLQSMSLFDWKVCRNTFDIKQIIHIKFTTTIKEIATRSRMDIFRGCKKILDKNCVIYTTEGTEYDMRIQMIDEYAFVSRNTDCYNNYFCYNFILTRKRADDLIEFIDGELREIDVVPYDSDGDSSS